MRLTLIATFLLAGCSAADNEEAANQLVSSAPAVTETRSVEIAANEPQPPVQAPASSAVVATPMAEASFAPDSAQAAAIVVQTYYALLGEGKYGQAYALWEPGAVGMSRRDFAASFAKFGEYRARIGAPGAVDAGAGQRDVTVPVQVFGRLKQGDRPFNMRGTVTLHRVGDIDGASAEQRRWRIRNNDIKPRPDEAAPAPAPSETADNRSSARYRCFDGSRLVANFDPDNRRVTIVRAGKSVVLRQQQAASGIRYADGRTSLSGKGDTLSLELPGQPPLACGIIRR